MQQLNSPSGNELLDDSSMNLRRYFSLFLSNWYWFAISLFLAMTVAYGINRYSEKIYTVYSTLLIKDDQVGRINGSLESVIPGGDIFKNQQNLRNEIGILKSFRLNDSVMKNLEDFHVEYVGVGRRGIVESRLYKTCPFKVLYDSLEIQPKTRVGIEILTDSTFSISLNENATSSDTIKFGERFRDREFDFTIVPRFPGRKIIEENASNKFYFLFADPDNLANQYRGKLSVVPIEKDASIVTLSVSGLNPEQEADYLNKLMEVYISYGQSNKTETAVKTIEFIDRQIKEISDSLLIAEGTMEKFRIENRFFDIGTEGAIIQNRLEKIENEKTAFELKLQYYNYLSEYITKQNAQGMIISPSLMEINDGVLIRLVNDLSSIQKEKEKLGFNIDADQEAFVLIDRQMKETLEALKENVRNGIEGLKLSLEESDRKLLGIDSAIKKLPPIEREYITIQRKFELNNTVYTYLLEKRAESGIAKASNIPDNREIDSASRFSTALIKPRTKYNLMFAFIVGLIMPMILITLIDYFNDKIIDKSDIERNTKVPIIGYISHSEGKGEIPVVEKPGSSLAESFRSVRTAIKYFIKENEKPVIAVSSTISSEGKTFISINLAAITAMLGKKVLLIGLDLRKPRINKVFQFDNSPGMSTYLSSNCKFEDVIKQTQIPNLFYAPSGPIPPNPSELIETDNMRIFMELARREFDYIIIDTPPVGIVTDALLLAPYVDLNLFIVRQRYSSRNTLEMIDQLYKQGELRNLAIIINDINLTGYYGYGMRYGYSNGYGFSYGYGYYDGGGYRSSYSLRSKKNEKGYYTEE